MWRKSTVVGPLGFVDIIHQMTLRAIDPFFH